MTDITVVGGTGYAGSAIVAEAARRGHRVTSFSRTAPTSPVVGVVQLQGDATDESALCAVIAGAEVVVAALAPRGALSERYREVNKTIARLARSAGASLYVVGGFSSLRPARGADRFVSDLSHSPAEYHAELQTVSAFVTEDLPATPEDLDWVFVSPAAGFGAHSPGQRTGTYRVGDDVAVDPDGGAISGSDYAIGFVDLIEAREHHRAHLNLSA